MLKTFIHQKLHLAKRSTFISRIFLLFLLPGCIAGPVWGQTPAAEKVDSAPPEKLFLPGFSDPRRRVEPPAQPTRKPIRFLTADDYPPFEFLDSDGNLAGLNIDVARAICAELAVACTIQPRRWDNLLDALEAKEGDALIASLKPAAAAGKARFTEPYYLTPARFAALAETGPVDVRPEALRGKTVGVEAGSAHEAFLRKFFSETKTQAFPDREKLFAALREKQVELVFGDAIGLSVLMNGAPNCCAFRGGPYLEPAYFGEGIGIGLRPEDEALRKELNWALQRLDETGKLTEFYLKYFPLGFY